jgi:hypothetical protein
MNLVVSVSIHFADKEIIVEGREDVKWVGFIALTIA